MINTTVNESESETDSVHRIRSDREAIEIARQLAAQFAPEAAERDRQRRLPFAELQLLSQSGLLGITIPQAYGGAFVSNVTLAEVIKILSAADASIGQIPQNHFYMIEALRLNGSEDQKRYYFEQVLQGKQLGNAFCEVGTKTPTSFKTRVETADSGLVLNGKKFYSTGALFADIVAVVALDQAEQQVVVFIDRKVDGLTVIDDWSGMGQRTTASGTTILENVWVEERQILRHHQAFEKQTTMGAIAQIMHAAIDVGIAEAAFHDALDFVRHHSRAWVDSGVEHAYEDPFLIYIVGEIAIKLRAAEALLQQAGEAIDLAIAEPIESRAVAASIAVAEAKALADEAAIWIANKLFEVSGTKSTLSSLNYDRHWRNARTHTLHDPVRWKYHGVGNYFLNQINPPRHGAF
jgi:SfnB family sulfur acquisition oxidoreductase